LKLWSYVTPKSEQESELITSLYDRLKLVAHNSRFLILPDLFKETPDPQLPGYLGVGQRPWTKGPAAFRLPIPKQTLHPTEPGH